MILNMDCRDGLATMGDNSVDAILTDPPYELGFMGHAWDQSGITNDVNLWREALRVLKPGGHLLAFGGTRTSHRMVTAIEDAGFEVRDSIMWVYGQGFPKSLDISKAIDKAAGVEREVIGSKIGMPGYSLAEDKGRNTYSADGRCSEVECAITAPATDAARLWQGWGTALKPAHEPICVARKPFAGTVAANVLTYGTGGININACRIPIDPEADASQLRTMNVSQHDGADGWGMNTTKPNPAARVLGMEGRWPANLIHDGSPEVLALFPDAAGARAQVKGTEPTANGFSGPTAFSGMIRRVAGPEPRGDSGSAARFFQKCEFSQADVDAAVLYYCAKASKSEKGRDNNHPTVKPISLGRYLSRLICPPGGVLLDIFAGSGSFPLAAKLEGFQAIGFEQCPESTALANARYFAAC